MCSYRDVADVTGRHWSKEMGLGLAREVPVEKYMLLREPILTNILETRNLPWQ